MKKLLLAAVLLLALAAGWSSYKEHLPPEVVKNIEQQTAGKSLGKDLLPEDTKGLLRIFNVEKEIRAKMSNPNWVKIKDIPLSMQQAIISVEDSRFYQHGTFDINGILRAILVNIQAGEVVEGGSTITQQLAKNLFLTQEQTAARKFKEGIYGILLESNFSKEEILEIYLNTIYFGSGAYGIKAAAATYFQITPDKLTMAQSTMLAGLPAAPSAYSPLVNMTVAKKRQAAVLETMVKNGFIGPQAAKDILNEQIF